jgi:hypothetical protein
MLNTITPYNFLWFIDKKFTVYACCHYCLFTETITVNFGFGETNVNKQFILFTFGQYTVFPRIEFTRGKTFLFFILRKNFRGITLFASFETPISVIKKSSSTQRKT